METDLARACLEALQSQLQPHFLFNALNTISALITREPKSARLAVVHLSDLLRAALQRSELQEVPLAEEVRFARSYLEIQRLRFGDRLELDIDVEPATLHTPVPPTLLQPILENAFGPGLPDEDPRAHRAARVQACGWRSARRPRQRARLRFRSARVRQGAGSGRFPLDHVRGGGYRLAFEDMELLEPSWNDR